MLPNAVKCQAYSFYYFWVIKGKLTVGGKNTPSAFHFVEIQSAFYPYDCSDPSFSRSILTLLYLKFETSSHTQIAFIH